MKSKTKSRGIVKLWQKVILGLLLGIVAGIWLKEYTEYLKPIGTIFINLIKMVVVPLIFFSLIAGITGMTDSQAFKRVGSKAVIAFLLTAMFAVCIGLVFGSVFKPGEGVKINFEETAPKPAAGIHNSVCNFDAVKDGTKPEDRTVIQQIAQITLSMAVCIVPTNAIDAMASDHILQVVVFAIFVAFTLNALGEQGKPLVEFSQRCAMLVFMMIRIIISFSPYGVFALTAWVVGTQGVEVLKALFYFMAVVAGAMVVQYLIFGLLIIVFARLSPMPFYRKMIEPQSLAFSTSSSKATLATAMETLQTKMGVSKNSASFVLPLGASINMDGTAIYLGICALFFAQATGTVLHVHEYVLIVLTSTLASIGAAGIPGGSLIMMGMVLTSVGLPLEGIALIAGVDRILDMIRTTINITGDSAITLIIDKTEGTLNEKKYYSKTE